MIGREGMLQKNQLPVEVQKMHFDLPNAYYKVFDLGLTNLTPWRFLEAEECQDLFSVLRQLYSGNVLLPFARRMDNDDVACLVVQSQEYTTSSVLIVHLFASSGDEVDHIHETFWDWFRAAVDEMIDAYA
ncbi:MAG: hypothetical protein SF029_18855 [bacterium]|nr:hypothetical protein [bacterium]